MLAAILCPGKTLERFRDDRQYAVRIGVNRAVCRFACQYWAALDAPTIWNVLRPRTEAEPRVIGKPVIVSTEPMLRVALQRVPELVQYSTLAIESILPKFDGHPQEPPKKTYIAAIHLALHLGAKRIDCWGMNWSGTKDFDGHAPEDCKRTAKRWEKEAADFEMTQHNLRAAGVELVRMVAGQPGATT